MHAEGDPAEDRRVRQPEPPRLLHAEMQVTPLPRETSSAARPRRHFGDRDEDPARRVEPRIGPAISRPRSRSPLSAAEAGRRARPGRPAATARTPPAARRSRRRARRARTQRSSATSAGSGAAARRGRTAAVKSSTRSCSTHPAADLGAILDPVAPPQVAAADAELLVQPAQRAGVGPSPQRGCVQQAFAQRPGVWYLPGARRWTSVRSPSTTKTDTAGCRSPRRWTSSLSTGTSLPSSHAGIVCSCRAPSPPRRSASRFGRASDFGRDSSLRRRRPGRRR